MPTVESESGAMESCEPAASSSLPSSLHRQRQKLTEMFKSSYCNWAGVPRVGLEVVRKEAQPQVGNTETTLHGFYVKLDHRSRAVHSEEISVHFVHCNGQLMYTVRPHDHRQGAGLQYLWTDHGNWVKLKSSAARSSREIPEKTAQTTRASGYKRKGDSCVVWWSRKGRRGYLRCPKEDIGPDRETQEVMRGGEDDGEDSEEGDNTVYGYNNLWNVYNRPGPVYCYHSDGACFKNAGGYKRKDSHFNKQSGQRQVGESNEDEAIRGRRDVKPINCWARNYLMARPVTNRNSKRWKRGIEAMKHESAPSLFEEDCCEHGTLKNYSDDDDDCRGHARPDYPTLGQFCSTIVMKKRPKSGAKTSYALDSLNDKFSANIGDTHPTHDLSSTKLHPVLEHNSSNGREDQDVCSTTAEQIGGEIVNTRTTTTINTHRRRSPRARTSSRETPGQEHVTVLLSRAATRPDCLSAEFRQDYREGACKPRRFVINISRLMYQHAILRTRLRIRLISQLDMSTYLVFVFSREFTSGDDEYRVWVNSVWSKAHVGKILRRFSGVVKDRKVVQIHELIEEVARAAEELDVKRLRARTESLPSEVRQRPVCLFKMLTTVARWETGSVSLPHTSEWCDGGSMGQETSSGSQETILSDVMALLNEKVSSYSQCNSMGPTNAYMCGICLLDFSSEDREEQPLPLALIGCSHWFCEDCWRSKVAIQLRSGRRPCHVDCPEKDCRGRVDPVTMLALMKVHDIRRMNQFKIANYVAASSLVKTCPNTSCRRILFARPQARAENSPLIVTCSCSRQICLQCSRAPHWPSSCGMSTRYQKLITETGEDVLTRTLLDGEFPDVVSRGKNCPRCRMFIQETTTLKFVTCACGCRFCWPCGKEIDGEVAPHTRCVDVFEQSDKVLKEIMLNGAMEQEDARKSRWHGTSLAHRKMRHPEVVTAMYAMADVIAKSIAGSTKSGHYAGDIERAAEGWDKNLAQWARENYDYLHSPKLASEPVLGYEDLDKHTTRTARPLTSASSNRPASSSFSNNPQDSDVSIFAAAAYNIVQSKLELHHIIEYTSVLLANTLHVPGQLVQSLERAEDICTALGILLQRSSGAQNPRQIIPAFLRVRRQAVNIIGNIVSYLEKVPSGVFWVDEN